MVLEAQTPFIFYLVSLVLLCVFRRGSVIESTFLPIGRGLGTLLFFKGSVAGYPCHF